MGMDPPHVTADIYLVRHGRTALNAAGVLRGRLDPPLDDVGRAEAGGLGEVFAALDLGAVVSSPLRRAVQTATAIARPHGLAVTTEPGLIDRDYGPWAGRRRADVERDGGPLDDLPDVERLDQLAVRVASTLERLAERAASSPVVAVAHDIVNRVLMADLSPDRFPSPDDVPQRPGCWNRLERAADGWHVTVVDAITPG
jgi:broad specificity phosphatase PhoE